MLDRLNAITQRRWGQVALLTLAGVLLFVLIGLGFHMLVFAGADAEMLWRDAVNAFVLPLLFIAPLLVLLGLSLTGPGAGT